MTSALTSDFRHEFERESLLHLRRRFLWYAGVVIGLNVLMGVLPLVLRLLIRIFLPASSSGLKLQAGTAADILVLGAYVWAFLFVRQRLLGRQRLVDLMTWLMVGAGVARMVTGFLDYAVVPNGRSEASVTTFASLSLMSLLWTALWTHILACVFVPWRPREAMRPVLYLSVAFACVGLAHLIRMGGEGWVMVIVSILLFPLVGVPGAALTLWNHDRFRETFLMKAIRGRYTEMKRELTDARRIHEALFPAPQQKGGVRFDYRYEPMRQIGGDFLYAKFVTLDDRKGAVLNMLLLDVTGHGIPAALTVNRLYGEVERLFAEHPHIRPGDVLRALNRYVYLTLSDHSMFVTALTVKVLPGEPGAPGKLLYASAGHPPAFLRAVDGTIDQLDSTAPVLGAFTDAEYEIETLERPFGHGDTFLGYTDGAMETRDGHGRMLGVNGLQRALAGTSRAAMLKPGEWTKAIIDAVDMHRVGPPTDDTLVVEVTGVIDQIVSGTTSTVGYTGLMNAANGTRLSEDRLRTKTSS